MAVLNRQYCQLSSDLRIYNMAKVKYFMAVLNRHSIVSIRQ
jgi:hypothetical protein